ncbi:MAG: alkaline phosphatase [Armatimonadetes bacterium]|nr:alkaline phosphatase [Armatimonadota bacterium]
MVYAITVMSITRRAFLGTSAAGLLAAACGGTTKDPNAQKKEAKNIIFCVSDGMAISVPTMVDQFSQLRDAKPSYWAALMNEPYATNGLQSTRSLSSVVTDSAAASAAWGSGRHIWNTQLNIFPDGTELRSITNVVMAQGMRTGLVTTTTITHATPAGFAVSSESRNDQAGIAAKYIESGVDVLMGGGDPFFNPEDRSDGRDLYADFAKKGFAVVKKRDALIGLRSNQILGVFNGSHLPYTVDRDNDPEIEARVPTLAEMSEVAIRNLDGTADGFLLQIEGGRVDHGAHGVDLAAMFFDQIAFEDAVKVAVDFALEDRETLVIITSDHACGGPALNGAGSGYFESTAGLLTLQGMKASYGVMLQKAGSNPNASQVQDVVEELQGIKLSGDEAKAVVDSMGGDYPLGISEFHRTVAATLASVLGNHSKVNWTCQNHTADHVLVTAVGPGSEQVGGLTENTQFFDMMLAMRGLEHSNPTMSYEEAVRHRSRLQALTTHNRGIAEILDEPADHVFLA